MTVRVSQRYAAPEAVLALTGTLFLVTCIDEAKEGLYYFNATLPLMFLQFIALPVYLNILFYKPVGSILDERNEYIRTSLTTGTASTVKADELAKRKWLCSWWNHSEFERHRRIDIYH